MTFVDQFLAGQVSADDIDDFVAKWHEGDGSTDLHAFLGLTRAEYGAWVKDPDCLTVENLRAEREA